VEGQNKNVSDSSHQTCAPTFKFIPAPLERETWSRSVPRSEVTLLNSMLEKRKRNDFKEKKRKKVIKHSKILETTQTIRLLIRHIKIK